MEAVREEHRRKERDRWAKVREYEAIEREKRDKGIIEEAKKVQRVGEMQMLK